MEENVKFHIVFNLSISPWESSIFKGVFLWKKMELYVTIIDKDKAEFVEQTKLGNNMLKFIHLFKNYSFGISFVGIAAFVLQEIPYIIMPLVKPSQNPIMNMQNESKWIEILQGIFGMLSMIMLILIVRDDVKLFPVETSGEKIFLSLTVLMILINFSGWTLYYLGHQYGWLIVISQFASVPMYYLFFGLWQSNFLLVGTAIPFFVIHTINGVNNFVVKK